MGCLLLLLSLNHNWLGDLGKYKLRALLSYLHFAKSPIHSSFIHIYHFYTLSLAVWQDTCHTYKNLVYDLANHESPIAQWLERPTGIWKVMGSTPIGDSENSFSAEHFDLEALVRYLSLNPPHFLHFLHILLIYTPRFPLNRFIL